jgi:hypothetical protein
MTWLVTLNSGGGSQSEAMDPQEVVVVETAAEAAELEEWVSRHSRNRYGDIRAIAVEVTEPVSLTDAKAAFEACYLLEDDEDDEDED